jgi:hypothetical protein
MPGWCWRRVCACMCACFEIGIFGELNHNRGGFQVCAGRNEQSMTHKRVNAQGVRGHIQACWRVQRVGVMLETGMRVHGCVF